MKTWCTRAMWVIVCLLALSAAIHPSFGVLYDNPMACLGVGLIGLGLMMSARQQREAAAAGGSG
ncbi:MAG: hypothetical protein ACLFVN_11635 [Phycisphaeraceae bacterium]